MQAQSIDEMMIKHETPYDVILCHLKDGSFLVLQCSEQVDVASDEWYVIFYHTVVYLFHTSGFFYRTNGHFFHTADQVNQTSEPSCENGLKLNPPGCHTATNGIPVIHGKSLVYVFASEVTSDSMEVEEDGHCLKEGESLTI